MGPFDRGLLFIYILVITILSIVAIAFLAGWAEEGILLSLYNQLPGQGVFLYSFLALVILAGIRLLLVNIRPVHKQVIVHEGALGQIRVTLTAVESLVEKIVSQYSGIRDIKARVVTNPQGIDIRVKIAVTPEINIPEISEKIQGQIKERVLEVTGMAVNQVHILVSTISAHKPRVE